MLNATGTRTPKHLSPPSFRSMSSSQLYSRFMHETEAILRLVMALAFSYLRANYWTTLFSFFLWSFAIGSIEEVHFP